MPSGLETITTGLSAAAFRRDGEILMCLGNSREMPAIGPLLAHHVIDANRTYEVSHLNSHQKDWSEIGVIKGANLQRIAVRIEGRGYGLYKCRERNGKCNLKTSL